MARKYFAKGYVFHDSRDHYIRVEEAYNGEVIEIQVGDDHFDCGCVPCSDCDPCNAESSFTVNLNREQVRELKFALQHVHFIDEEPKKKK